MKKINSSFLAVLVISMLGLSGCFQNYLPQTTGRTPVSIPAPIPKPIGGGAAQAKLLKGVSLSPKSFQGSDFTDFLDKASQAGVYVSWAGDWNSLSDLEKGTPTVVTTLGTKYNYVPIIEVQFFTQSTGKLLRPLDDSTIKNYQDEAVAFVKKFKPEYFGMGIEINTLAKKSPADFAKFVDLFNSTTEAIKTANPYTRVFTVFQLEQMKGLNGGLFGGKNDPKAAQWDLLTKFSKADFFAFTSYPGLIYHSPADLPADYYTEISKQTDKPIAISELGWNSDSNIKGWEGSEKSQADFVDKFFELIKDLKPEFVLWSFVYDPNTVEPFKGMGLIGSDGKEKAAWAEWLKY